jgi:AhpD family alkylhydroperoxidase
MGGGLIRTALQRTLLQARHITVVPPARARDLVATVYARAEHDYGMLSPAVAVHSPAPDLLAAAWILLRETFVADGGVDRVTKEAVATSVSLENACHYAADLHLATLDALNEQRDTAADDQTAAIADDTIRLISEWARTRTGKVWRTAPFSATQAPELVAAVVATHYLNRMTTLFLPDSAVPAGVPDTARPMMLRLLGRTLLSAANAPHAPGEALDLLPDVPTPADLAWSQNSPTVAAALARVVAATDAAGARTVPEPVQALVQRELAQWQGDNTGVGVDWASARASEVDTTVRPAARLALLAALAPDLVDQATVEDFRDRRPEDRDLVELTAWASMAAARRVGAWIAPEPMAGGAQILRFRRRSTSARSPDTTR